MNGVRYLLGACLAGTMACSYQPAIERGQLDRGYVMLLTGVECYGSYHAGVVRGLRDGGVDAAIELVEWGYKPFGTFRNLRNYPANRDIAATASLKVLKYRADYPGRPITILGYSGGGAMALWLAESLPPEFRVERIVLTAPAISPEYDVSAALTHARRGMVVFYSHEDWFMAGMATQIWGTMDRKKSETAGRVGFQNAEGALLTRDGLTQIAWRPEWRRFGHNGSHSGYREAAWAREVLAPWVSYEPQIPVAQGTINAN